MSTFLKRYPSFCIITRFALAFYRYAFYDGLLKFTRVFNKTGARSSKRDIAEIQKILPPGIILTKQN